MFDKKNICSAHFRMNYCVLSRTFVDRSHFLLDLWIKGNEEQSYYENSHGCDSAAKGFFVLFFQD